MLRVRKLRYLSSRINVTVRITLLEVKHSKLDAKVNTLSFKASGPPFPVCGSLSMISMNPSLEDITVCTTLFAT